MMLGKEAWWIIGILVILQVGVGVTLYRLKQRIRLLTTKEREAREGSDRLLRTLHESRDHVARLSGEHTRLSTQLEAVMHAVVLLPLPPDMRSCYAQGVAYLPRTAYKGNGCVSVAIPGMSIYSYMLHIDPNEQTVNERARIYDALRHSTEARALLGIGMS